MQFFKGFKSVVIDSRTLGNVVEALNVDVQSAAVGSVIQFFIGVTSATDETKTLGKDDAAPYAEVHAVADGSSMQLFNGAISVDNDVQVVPSHFPARTAGRAVDVP